MAQFLLAEKFGIVPRLSLGTPQVAMVTKIFPTYCTGGDTLVWAD